MAQEWPKNAPEGLPGSPWSYDIGQDAKPAGGVKMGDPKDVAWMASSLREQGCEILALKDEIKRLRTFARWVYEHSNDPAVVREAIKFMMG